ncbi:replication restart helicase PriA [Haliangium sp.]|uniref:replication restart helicase PriA n=1 Tax=Haliangium sp. TaxID=2663208 RepID=UPI003D108A10
MRAAPRYAEVAVQLPVDGTYCYEVPERLVERDLRGARVLVPFGNRGVAGVVVGVSDELPEGVHEPRAIDALLADEAPIPAELLALCLWVAAYYEAPPGEALRVALPVGSQVSARLIVELTPEGEAALGGGGALAPRWRDVLGLLAQAEGGLPRSELLRGDRAGRKLRPRDLSAVVEAGLARYRRELERARVQARSERTAVLVDPVDDDDRARLAQARARLSRAPKQLAALEALERAGGAAAVAALRTEEPRVATHLRALAQAGLVRFESRRAAPGVAQAGVEGMRAPVAPPTLTGSQEAALSAIREGLGAAEFGAYLLYGITGSGKTEVYLHAIADVLSAGKCAVVLVPEISLTPQLAARFRARFGDLVAVLHSGLTDRERYDEWQRLRAGDARIALGARSAVFAPVSDLGMVVVDEEHDSSFKQEEGVRYNARDVALVRAQRAGAVCVLGSATPSLETYYAAESGRYRLLSLPERPTPRPLPKVALIDLRVYRPEADAMLTAPLAEAIRETLDRGEQVILFLNRRGFDTFVLCRACGEAFRCEQCSVSLTYHRARDILLCHYCGYQRRIPKTCPTCGRAGSILRRGLGTEKVAAAVGERFPGAHVGRLDRDVATGARIGEVLGRMARGEIDILVGTQMVTKGHDFPGVTLVGVLCADTGLSLPDFRASERTFQLLTQVAGRAGRGERPGRVLIQSYRTEAVAVSAAAHHDYEGFYRAERVSRQELGYPPFGHLAAIRFDGPDARVVERAARRLAERVAPASLQLGVSVLGPAEAPLARLKGRARWHMWLRASTRRPLRRVLEEILRGGPEVLAQVPAEVRIGVDVDPISAL